MAVRQFPIILWSGSPSLRQRPPRSLLTSPQLEAPGVSWMPPVVTTVNMDICGVPSTQGSLSALADV